MPAAWWWTHRLTGGTAQLIRFLGSSFYFYDIRKGSGGRGSTRNREKGEGEKIGKRDREREEEERGKGKCYSRPVAGK